MKLMDMVGMMSTGALIMLGGIYLLEQVRGPDTLQSGTATAAVQAVPTAQPAAAQPVAQAPDAPATEPVLQAAPAVEVTRAQSDMTGSTTIGQLESFVALSMQPQEADIPLTSEQEEIIAYFRRTARDLNSASEGYSGDYVAFNDMSIDRLEIRHFYTVRQDLSDVPVSTLLASQAELVQANICQEPMMRTLMEEHGFRFTYSYVSQDNRFLGNVRGNSESCAS